LPKKKAVMNTLQRSNGEELTSADNQLRGAKHGRSVDKHKGVREAEEYGPFGFLNPTTRRYAFDAEGGGGRRGRVGEGRRGSDEEENVVSKVEGGEGVEEEDGDGDEEKDEFSKNVKRVWRTRDNRKGILVYLSYLGLAHLNWQIPSSLSSLINIRNKS